jgi:uncharacterized protein (DUF362 family)
MDTPKQISRRDVVAASGAVLLPLGIACDASAQTQPAQQTPGRAAQAGARPPQGEFFYPGEGSNKSLGIGKGIHPGRVSWVHNPEACTWDGKTGEWWDDAGTNGPLVERMFSRTLQNIAGQKNDKASWDALFRHFNQARYGTQGGYKPGEKITIKINCNFDKKKEGWPTRKGMTSPHLVNALIAQLIKVAGVPGKDITLYDVADGRYIGDPIYERIRANQGAAFQDVTFMCNTHMAGNGRVPPIPDETDPLRFSNEELARTLHPRLRVPTLVAEARYRINLACWRSHDVAGVTLCTKNNFGSIYWENLDYWGPRPFHAGWIQKTRPMGSYSVFTDVMAHNQLGRKNMLYIIDGLYAAEHSELDVVRFVSFGDHWTASVLMSQDPVAIDSVAFDFLRAEPHQAQFRGNPDNYLHEAALIEKPPSGTAYMPSGERLSSLGVHEHWNNPWEKKYSRNLGRNEGIELVALKA